MSSLTVKYLITLSRIKVKKCYVEGNSQVTLKRNTSSIMIVLAIKDRYNTYTFPFSLLIKSCMLYKK